MDCSSKRSQFYGLRQDAFAHLSPLDGLYTSDGQPADVEHNSGWDERWQPVHDAFDNGPRFMAFLSCVNPAVDNAGMQVGLETDRRLQVTNVSGR